MRDDPDGGAKREAGTESVPTPARPRRRWGRALAIGTLALAILLGTLAAAGAWLLGTEDGLRKAFELAERATDGALRAEGVEGPAGGPLRIASLRLRTATLRVEGSGLALDWDWRSLGSGLLWIRALSVERLRVATVPSDQPPKPPASLRIPLALRLDALDIGTLEIAKLPGADGAPPAAPLLLQAVHAEGDSDGDRLHRLRALRLRSPWGALAADGELGASPPYVLRADARFEGDWPEGVPLPEAARADAARRLAATLKAGGTLERLRVDLDADGEVIAARARLALRPWEPVPLERADVTADGIDPADWAEGAPSARLSLRAQLSPRAPEGAADPSDWRGWVVTGPVSVTNLVPGALDAGRLPLRELRATPRWQGGTLTLPDLRVLTTGGEITGRAALDAAGRAVDATLALDGLDLKPLHGALRPTRLSGEARLRASPATRTLVATLSQPAAAGLPALEAVIDAARPAPDRLVLNALRLRAPGRGDARLELSGELGLQGARRFTATGRLAGFDPSLFVKMPPATLNATLDASGALGAAGGPEARLRFALTDSRLDGRPLSGTGNVDVAGGRLTDGDLDLDLAGNRAKLKGAWGRPGDELAFDVDAPALANLGFGLGGALRAEGRLGGTPEAPAGRVQATSDGLTLPGGLRLAALRLQARVERGLDGPVSGTLEVDGLRDERAPLLRRARAALAGTLGAHVLEATVDDLRGGIDLALRARGALDTEAVAWTGSVERLDVDGPEKLRLAAPVPVSARRDAVRAGPARILSPRAARIVVDEVAWSSTQGVRSRGGFEDAPLPPELSMIDRARSTLRLSGRWDLVLPADAPPTGSVGVTRAAGDLALVGGPPLELSELRVDVRTEGGRLRADARLQGARAGTLSARGAVRLARAGEGWAVAMDGPLEALAELSMPDLSWLGPVAGPGIRTAGRLTGRVTAGGTPRDPRIAGNLDGDALDIALLDQGVELADGRLRLAIEDSLLTLREARFSSPVRVRPADRRLGDEALSVQAGTLQAQGSLRIDRALVEGGTGQGLIRITFDRFAALQARDRWVMASGWATLTLEPGRFELQGQARADAAFVTVDDDGGTSLSSDVVVIRRRPAPAAGRPATDGRDVTVASGDAGAHPPSTEPARAAPPLTLDFGLDTGDRFFVRGRGLDARLAGSVRVRGRPGGTLIAEGTIRTVGGTFTAYNQKLEIERGVVNFNGPIENPGLNVRAVRRNLPVTPGVEVTGTVQQPRIRLVSDPPMPDAEKLSWLVLGYAPDQLSGREQELLGQAALALLAGQGGGGGVSRVFEDLGLDVGIRNSLSTGPGARMLAPGATIAGSTTLPGMGTRIVSVGRRLSSQAYLSVEQSLTGSLTLVQLTYQLSRRLSLVARTGAENALDLIYAFSFR